MSRLISWVRPFSPPRRDSRSVRPWVALGSMAYSAVSQPPPEACLKGGTCLLHRGGAQDPGATPGNQAGAFGKIEIPRGDVDLPEPVRATPAAALHLCYPLTGDRRRETGEILCSGLPSSVSRLFNP